MSALLVFNEGKILGERRIKTALHLYLFTFSPFFFLFNLSLDFPLISLANASNLLDGVSNDLCFSFLFDLLFISHPWRVDFFRCGDFMSGPA